MLHSPEAISMLRVSPYQVVIKMMAWQLAMHPIYLQSHQVIKQKEVWFHRSIWANQEQPGLHKNVPRQSQVGGKVQPRT